MVKLICRDGGLQRLNVDLLFITTLSLLLRKIQLPSKGAFDKAIYSDIKNNVILNAVKDLTVIKILRLTLRMTFLLYDVTLRSVVVQVLPSFVLRV